MAKTKNKKTIHFYGLLSDYLFELIFSFQDCLVRLKYSEELDLLRQQYSEPSLGIYLPMEESLENFEMQLNEQLYLELCKALGSDKITFMGIA